MDCSPAEGTRCYGTLHCVSVPHDVRTDTLSLRHDVTQSLVDDHTHGEVPSNNLDTPSSSAPLERCRE
jgi:hypothetical protein